MSNPILYYTNASGDATWETLTNWNTAQDGSGDTPTEIPWTNTNGSTSASDLYGNGATINIGTVIDSGVTGTCYINQPASYGDIYGGTWVCYGLYSYGNIYGGTFNGDGIVVEGGYIGGGNFFVETYVYVESGGTIDYQRLTFYGSTYGYEWYFTNASGDRTWENLENWSIYPHYYYDGGFGLYRPTEAPWSGQDGSTNASNLYATPNNNQTLYKSSDTSAEVTGTCHIDWVYNSGNIYGGTWAGTFSNGGNIYAGTLVTGWFFNEGGTVYEGTFTHYGNKNYSDIYDGTFTGANFINLAGYYYFGSIHGGTFTGINFHNYESFGNGNITGGTFEITGFDNGAGTIDFPNISVTSGGVPYTGNWLGQMWSNGNPAPPDYSTIYYTNAGGDNAWENLANWTDANGSYNLTEVPWSGNDGSTSASNLHDASGPNSVNINSTIIPSSITGSCNIFGVYVYYSSEINGGTWTGDGFDNTSGIVNGGTFTGNGCYNEGGTINGGTFSGNYFSNVNYGSIYGGTFSGNYFTNVNDASIYGGTFSGNNFSNGGDYYSAGHIFGGTYNIEGFSNYNGTIDFPNISVTSGGNPYTGIFLDNCYSNGVSGNYGCTNQTACNYDPSAICDDGSCSWNCNDIYARNYHDGNCNNCWYTDCNDSYACNYDQYSFGISECTYTCNDIHARNYHSYCYDNCWYTDCNDYYACNYDSNSFGISECSYPIDYCHNCAGTYLGGNDCAGVCYGDAITDCKGHCYSFSESYGDPVYDIASNTCARISLDGLGFCCGDAVLDCGGIHYYSPSKEDGGLYTVNSSSPLTQTFTSSLPVSSVHTLQAATNGVITTGGAFLSGMKFNDHTGLYIPANTLPASAFDSFTITAWVKGTGNLGDTVFFKNDRYGYGRLGSGNGFNFYINSSNHLVADTYTPYGSFFGSPYTTSVNSVNLADNNWHFCTVKVGYTLVSGQFNINTVYIGVSAKVDNSAWSVVRDVYNSGRNITLPHGTGSYDQDLLFGNINNTNKSPVTFSSLGIWSTTLNDSALSAIKGNSNTLNLSNLTSTITANNLTSNVVSYWNFLDNTHLHNYASRCSDYSLDCASNCCGDSTSDCAGVCNGDAKYDNFSNCYSPSCENGYCQCGDQNGIYCSCSSVDQLGICYGNCADNFACAEDIHGNCLYNDDCGACGGTCHNGCDRCGNCGGIDGCTFSWSCNYNPSATCNDGSCYDYSDSCHDSCGNCTCGDCGNGCGTQLDVCGVCDGYCFSYCGNCNDSYCVYGAGGSYGCTDSSYCNYNSSATCDDGSCAGYYGCTNGTYCNYDPGAGCDDGSCSGYYGCTNGNACNYDPYASCDDGSCYNYSGYCYDSCGNCTCGDCGLGCDTYNDACSVCQGSCNTYCGDCNDENCVSEAGGSYGCTDNRYCNYNSSATCDDGSCSGYYGCTDSNACNYDYAASCDDGSCYNYSNYCQDSCGNCVCDDCGAGCGSSLDACSVCNGGCNTYCGDCNDSNCVNEAGGSYGCTDSSYCNYNSSATCDDGSCSGSGYFGCTDSSYCNYDPGAGCDDGSCAGYYGCTNSSYCNYDPGAGCDNGSCSGYYGCTDSSACNYDPSASCDDGSCAGHYGCTNGNACNYDYTASCDDGSCNGYTGCTNSSSCNYDPGAGCDDGNCTGYYGCTNSSSCNYDPGAGCDDGSCYNYSDYCRDSCGYCTCNDCGNGCGTETDSCGNCVAIGTGFYGNCAGGFQGCETDAYDYFSNHCCFTDITTDFFGNTVCNGYTPSCINYDACGENIHGCLYYACNGHCSHRTQTAYPNCPQPSVNPTLLHAYKLGILPIPSNNPAIRNRLLAEINNFPLIIQASVSATPTFGSSGFQWMTMNPINADTATGIGQNNITVSITQTGGGMFNHTGMVGAGVFPIEYGVPLDGNQIGNTQAGVFTATFSQPVLNPLVAFASVGQQGTAVPVIVSKPFTPIWDQTGYTTYQSPTGTNQYSQFTGEEGYNIIRLDGVIQEVVFNYTVSENYCTVCFGFVNQN